MSCRGQLDNLIEIVPLDMGEKKPEAVDESSKEDKVRFDVRKK